MTAHARILIVALWLALSGAASATISVIDINSIRTNLLNAKQALAEQVLHGKHQLEQIRHLVRQIEQADNYLKRLGDPKSVSLSTFNEAVGFLNELDFSKSSEDIIEGLSGEEIFSATPHSPHKAITPEIIIDGRAVALRDTTVFTPEVAERRTHTHYRDVRASALRQRARIKKEIEATLGQLRAASTASEVAKLNTLLRALESNLAANDREVSFAANEVLTRHLENEMERRVQSKARVQREREALRLGTKNDLQFYRLPTTPLKFKR